MLVVTEKVLNRVVKEMNTILMRQDDKLEALAIRLSALESKPKRKPAAKKT